LAAAWDAADRNFASVRRRRCEHNFTASSQDRVWDATFRCYRFQKLKTMIAKIAKRRAIGVKTGSRQELRNELEDIVTLRAQGLLNQSEYEEKLQEVERSLPQTACLAEVDLPSGGTCFVLRESGVGRVLGSFEFHHGHSAESLR
jgi:hypothetical protein